MRTWEPTRGAFGTRSVLLTFPDADDEGDKKFGNGEWDSLGGCERAYRLSRGTKERPEQGVRLTMPGLVRMIFSIPIKRRRSSPGSSKSGRPHLRVSTRVKRRLGPPRSGSDVLFGDPRRLFRPIPAPISNSPAVCTGRLPLLSPYTRSLFLSFCKGLWVHRGVEDGYWPLLASLVKSWASSTSTVSSSSVSLSVSGPLGRIPGEIMFPPIGPCCH